MNQAVDSHETDDLVQQYKDELLKDLYPMLHDPFRWAGMDNYLLEFLKSDLREKFARCAAPNLISEGVNFLRDENNFLGRGSYGAVYACNYEGKTVAVKFFELQGIREREIKAILTEIKHNLNLKHKNIVQCLGFHQTPDFIKMVMEKCSISLQTYFVLLEKHNFPRFSSPQVSALCTDICAGLNYIHLCGIIHRDLSLGNILLSPDWTVKIVDFGCSEEMTTLRVATGVKGTTVYLSPEAQEEFYSFSSDIWSFGVLMASICASEVPSVGEKWTLRESELFLDNFEFFDDDEWARAAEWRVATGGKSLAYALRRREQCLKSIQELHPEMLHIAHKCFQIESSDVHERGFRGTAGDLVHEWTLLRNSRGWVNVEFPMPKIEEFLSTYGIPVTPNTQPPKPVAQQQNVLEPQNIPNSLNRDERTYTEETPRPTLTQEKQVAVSPVSQNTPNSSRSDTLTTNREKREPAFTPNDKETEALQAAVRAMNEALVGDYSSTGRTLDLSNLREYGQDDGTLLRKALQDNENVTTLNLTNTRIKMASISETLKKNTTITTLILADNLIDFKDAPFLAEILNENKTITALDVSKTFHLMGSRSFLKELKTNTLKSLNLSNNKALSMDISLLAQFLTSNTSLTSLNLSSCGINDQTSRFLSAPLVFNHNLAHIDLSNNDMSPPAAERLVLNAKNSAISFNFSGNPIILGWGKVKPSSLG
eukprot:TRINITY_DN13175_c0_g1_i1.p1 TRINITY_DN13175_c0_g1~~TRINITY_DN13175_c0_g1_i1.p1  ORF type:complete len:710 (-),score=106.69 TRINITY_DN13175_c0_g1_i1:84-2213(-)